VARSKVMGSQALNPSYGLRWAQEWKIRPYEGCHGLVSAQCYDVMSSICLRAEGAKWYNSKTLLSELGIRMPRVLGTEPTLRFPWKTI